MTFLELVKRLGQEAHVNGTITTVANQTGEWKRLVDWTADAWTELQGTHLWPWMWESATVTIAATTSVAAGSISHARYLTDTARIGDAELTYLPWDEFRANYKTITEGTPTVWSIRPDLAFAVNYAPAASTGITVERYRNPTVLAADADTPEAPVDTHMAVVWGAMKLYAGFEEDGTAFNVAQANLKPIQQRLARLLPTMQLGSALLLW